MGPRRSRLFVARGDDQRSVLSARLGARTCRHAQHFENSRVVRIELHGFGRVREWRRTPVYIVALMRSTVSEGFDVTLGEGVVARVQGLPERVADRKRIERGPVTLDLAWYESWWGMGEPLPVARPSEEEQL